jgi:hypothetical protein
MTDLTTEGAEDMLDDMEESGYVRRWYRRGGTFTVYLNDDTDAPLHLDVSGVEELRLMMW